MDQPYQPHHKECVEKHGRDTDHRIEAKRRLEQQGNRRNQEVDCRRVRVGLRNGFVACDRVERPGILQVKVAEHHILELLGMQRDVDCRCSGRNRARYFDDECDDQNNHRLPCAEAETLAAPDED